MDPVMLVVLIAALAVATAIFWQLLQYFVNLMRQNDLTAMTDRKVG
jgi:hypothetical protein